MEIARIKSLLSGRRGRIIILVVVVFFAGYFFKSLSQPSAGPEHEHSGREIAAQDQAWWTCSMHPQIRQPKPGKCPICFMDLIPISSAGGEIGPRQISFSKEAIRLMQIETTPVERRFVTAEIRMFGKVDYDETRVKNITAWVPGRIDRLFVDFTGITVNKGDHMVELYSPQLISAQTELHLSSTKPLVREKLRRLGLTVEQIDEIEKTGKVVDHLTIYAPIGGIVINKNAKEGMYVDTGAHIYTVADLSKLWVKLDAYESDMMWLRYGQEVEFTAEAYPGEVFKGRISFIDPVLDAKTRTFKLRVNVDNPEGKLKPEMFVKAVVRSKVAQGGRVMDPEMAGKWICPMHPDVVKTEAGSCDICEMDLVTPESLGYIEAVTPAEAPLVIPASVPLITGTRAVVYVQLPEVEKPTFEGREVVLGPRAGEFYIVESGLAEGEVVVTNGNFKIDSAMQIQAKPSMMSEEGGQVPPETEAKEVASAIIEQTTCPVMGGAINKDIFTEYKGKKVYFCCPGCKPEFEKNPEKYLVKLPQFNK
jgi:Cu(I)/Ag(I) efflux system membrane fusion protein